MRTSSRFVALFAIALVGLGGFCVVGGAILAILRIAEPDRTALSVPVSATPSPIVPTPAALSRITLEPPPLREDTVVQIMPVMEIVTEISTLPIAIPSNTPTVSLTLTPPPSKTSTLVFPSLTATTFPTPTVPPSPIPTLVFSSLTPWLTLPPAYLETIPIRLPSATPTPPPAIPERIEIPQINLDAPIVPVGWHTVQIGGQIYGQWDVPQYFASGWHNTSVVLGKKGNTVLNGHHNAWDRVFGKLVNVQPGDTIILYTNSQSFRYTVVQTMILLERDQPLSVRLENARWLLPSQDERVTLVTCWPENDNSHRLVVVALPSGEVRQQQQPHHWVQPNLE